MKHVTLSLTILALAALAGCAGDRGAGGDAPARATSAPAKAPAAPVATPVLRAGAHDDHDPKHGGILLMDANLYHHFEGTHAEPGVFRLYLYDDYTKPIDAKGTTGSILVRGAPASSAVPLEYDDATQTLVARIVPPPPLPLLLDVTLNLTNPLNSSTATSAHEFEFKAVGGEAHAAHGHDHDHGHGHDHADGGHSHGSGDHEHVAAHGGQVVEAGTDHHFELVRSGGLLTLWILDVDEKTLTVEGMEASLLVQPKGKAPIQMPLPAMGNVHFMGNSPLSSDESAVVVASVKMRDGKTLTARFTLGAPE